MRAVHKILKWPAPFSMGLSKWARKKKKLFSIFAYALQKEVGNNNHKYNMSQVRRGKGSKDRDVVHLMLLNNEHCALIKKKKKKSIALSTFFLKEGEASTNTIVAPVCHHLEHRKLPKITWTSAQSLRQSYIHPRGVRCSLRIGIMGTVRPICAYMTSRPVWNHRVVMGG